MSAYWNFVLTMTPGTLAKAEDINVNLEGINTGLNSVEAEINKTIQVTNDTGVTDIGLNAVARANKIITFDVNGDIAASTILGDYKGDHADAAGTDYEIRDTVKDAAASIGQDNIYICNTTHTSTGDLATDTANWDLLVDTAQAMEWAQKVDGIVDAVDYSAKAYSIGGTGVTNTAGKGAAKEWATKAEDSTVDTVDYSALHWAAKAAASAVLTAADVTYTGEWANKAEDSLVSAAAGGDQVDDYSALHHAKKAAASAAIAAVANVFNCTEQTVPDMTVSIGVGRVFDGDTLTNKTAQNSATITAPSVNPRIDRVVVDQSTGVASVITGAEAASPVAPDITDGKAPIAQIALATTTTTITDSLITDERTENGLAVQLNDVHAWGGQQNTPKGTLTWGANVAWNLNEIQVAQLTLSGATAELDNPTNMVDGASYAIKVIQDATGSRALTFGTAYDWMHGAAPDLTALAANEYGWITFMSDGTNMSGVFQGPFS